MKTIALIPAFEPDYDMIDVCRRLSFRAVQTIVVDDGSGPDYKDLFDAVRMFDGVEVISYEKNGGKGHALHVGYAAIEKRLREAEASSKVTTSRSDAQPVPSEHVVIVTLDCDGQHDVADALACATEAAEFPDALVLGKRDFNAPEVPLRSRFGNHMSCLAYRISTGIKLGDTQTGLRAFDARLLPLIAAVGGERYDHEMRVILMCPRKDIPLREVPIRTIYNDANAGSHFQTLRDSWLVWRPMVLFAGSSLLCFGTDVALFALLAMLVPRAFHTSIVMSATLANVGARLVSASLNYLLNRSVVFGSAKGICGSALQYALLACSILCANTLILQLIASMGIQLLAAKVAAGMTMFVVSWLVQSRLIFRRYAL